MRAYYALVLARRDKKWVDGELQKLQARYPDVPRATPVLISDSANRPIVEKFISELNPDFMLARCKQLIKPSVYSIPKQGTFVLHPGVCPEYRNAHGCFWALAGDDIENVGMTLLKIDPGVDTGPVYGYFSYTFDELNESHIVIQYRVVLENLDALRDRILSIIRLQVEPLNTFGRPSAVWGQPWLTRYLRWRWRAHRRKGS